MWQRLRTNRLLTPDPTYRQPKTLNITRPIRSGREFCELDAARHAGGARKPTVTCQQRRIEDLGERHVDRVVGAQVLSKLPYAIKQWLMRVALQIQNVKILEREGRFSCIELAVFRVTPECLSDLDICQVRHVQTEGRIGNPRGDRLSCRGVEQELH